VIHGYTAERLLQVFGDLYINHEAKLAPTLTERVVEGFVHELAHAAVMGIDAPHFAGAPLPRRISDEVSAVFKGMRSVPSDLSECEALAVEVVVMRFLGIEVDGASLCRYASLGMKTSTYSQPSATFEAMEFFLTVPATFARAFVVVAWIADIAG
jgi:hypothetical protein